MLDTYIIIIMYFDIGANVGKWSIANINNCNKIIAIEASPKTFSKLINNVKSYNNVECLNFAVCNSDDKFISFFDSNADTISSLNEQWLNSPSSRFYQYTNYKKIDCETIKLDSLINKYGVPELIKIDVEGGEFEVIKSLTKKANYICFEWASETNDITIDCINHLINLGYENFAIQFEDNYLYRPSEYTTSNSVINILNLTTPKKEWGMIWVK
jgi:FkbM family methyltransferase